MVTKLHVRVMLDEPIVASKVRLTNFDIVAGDTQWNGVSVVSSLPTRMNRP